MIDPSKADDATAKCDRPPPVEATPPEPAEELGQSFGPYTILRVIGAGGFGTVFEGEQQRPVKRRVALKLIKLGMDTREVIARFEAERQALALMEHPNIARVIDAGANAAGRPYFVMELVHGEPISHYCDSHRLTLAERLRLFEQVCAAVQHAHAKGVIHRDLKPSNVLVSAVNDQPLAKVIDFGIAKATSGHLTEHSLLTGQVQLIGTPHYMSPEQARGSADIDTRADIYSLGALLYQLLTDTTPFESTSLHNKHYGDLLEIICEREPPRPSTRLAHPDTTLREIADKRRTEPRTLVRIVHGELDWIVMKALEKDRTRRYETAAALALDVRRYLTGQPLLAAPPSKAYRFGKFVRRNRLAVTAGSMVTVSLIVGLVAFAWQARIAREQARIAEQRATELQQVSEFQADMLKQVDPTAAGVLLTRDVNAKFEQALSRAGVPQAERAVQAATFAGLWQRVNATDAARDLIDSTLLKPAIGAIDQQFRSQPVVDATLRQVLASRYTDMGLFEAALPLQQRALAIRQRALGPEHPDTLSSSMGMGAVLQLMDKLNEAESYLRDAVEKSRRVLGQEHPATLDSIHYLAQLLQEQDKLSEAETLIREALEKRRRVLGDDHPDTLASLNRMGEILRLQDRLEEAEQAHREALAGRRRVLGEDDPETLVSLNNLGITLQSQGKLGEAEPYAREGLEKRRRVSGETYYETLATLNNLAVLLHMQGKLAEAELHYREVLEKQRIQLGSEHSETLAPLTNLGVVLQQQGKLAEAEPYVREALQTKQRVLGPEHHDTLMSLTNLGQLLHLQGKLTEAEPHLRDALDKKRRVLGEEHASTLISAYSLASLSEAQGKHAEAIDMLTRAEPATRKAFTGSNAYRTGRLLTTLGSARAAMRDFPAAEAALLEAHRVLAESPGPSPTFARDCARGLADLYRAWAAADPGKDHAARAAEWKQRSADLEAPGPAQAAAK